MWWSSAVSMAGPATLRNEDGAMRNVTERKKSAETFVSALPWIRKTFLAGDYGRTTTLNGTIEVSILPDKGCNRFRSLPDLFLS